MGDVKALITHQMFGAKETIRARCSQEKETKGKRKYWIFWLSNLVQDLDQVCRFLLKAFCLTSLTWAPRWVAMECARVCVCGGGRSSRGGWSKRQHFGVKLKKKEKNATLLKAFKGLWEGEEVSAVAFLWKRYFPLQNKTRTDNRFPKKPVSVILGERCASPPNV